MTEQANRGTQSPPAGPDDFSLFEVAAVLLRRRWAVVGFSLAIPFLVGTVTLVLPRQWTATTSFTPQGTEASRSQLSSLAGQFGLDLGGIEAGQSPEFYADLVRSPAILRTVADEEYEVADTLGLFATGTIRSGRLADLLEIPPKREELRTFLAMQWLQKEALFVTTDPQTGIVTLSVTTRWPSLSGAVASRIVDLVNAFNLETRQSQAAAERAFVEERLETAQEELRAAENVLQRFLQNNRAFQNSPELVFEHDRLQRRVAMRQQVYTTLVQSYEQARIGEVRNTPVITVIESPEEPVRPDPRRLILKVLLGGVFGVMLGAFVAFAREFSLRRKEEAPDEYLEVSAAWADTRADLERLLRFLGRAPTAE